MQLHQPIYLLFLFNLFFLAALTQQSDKAWISLFAMFSIFSRCSRSRETSPSLATKSLLSVWLTEASDAEGCNSFPPGSPSISARAPQYARSQTWQPNALRRIDPSEREWSRVSELSQRLLKRADRANQCNGLRFPATSPNRIARSSPRRREPGRMPQAGSLAFKYGTDRHFGCNWRFAPFDGHSFEGIEERQNRIDPFGGDWFSSEHGLINSAGIAGGTTTKLPPAIPKSRRFRLVTPNITKQPPGYTN